MNNRNKNAQSFNLNELRKKTSSDLRQEILLHGLTVDQITPRSDIVSCVLNAHSPENLGNTPQDNPRIDFNLMTEKPSCWPSSKCSDSPTIIFKRLLVMDSEDYSPIDEISMIGEFDDRCHFDKVEVEKAMATYYGLLSKLFAQEEPKPQLISVDRATVDIEATSKRKTCR